MNEEEKTCKDCLEKFVGKHQPHRHHGHGGDSSILYCLGVVGSLFYFLQGATTFVAVITGIAKSFLWPALVVFKLLSNLQI